MVKKEEDGHLNIMINQLDHSQFAQYKNSYQMPMISRKNEVVTDQVNQSSNFPCRPKNFHNMQLRLKRNKSRSVVFNETDEQMNT